MLQLRRILTLAMLVAGISCWAEKVDGIIVKVGDDTTEIALSDIKEITFSDDGMTVVRTDDSATPFSGAWQLVFGQVDSSGIADPVTAVNDGTALIYDIDGRLIKETTDIRNINSLPKGVYIVKRNGKSLKIRL